MKRFVYLTMAVALVVVPAVAVLKAAAPSYRQQTGPPIPSQQPQINQRPRPRMDFVKTADFYLRDGRFVHGKLLDENKNRITVEELQASKIVVATYSKREIDTRTLDVKGIPESKYYIRLGEYFAGRTWDFRDDPDDFIQAIRCYEKARRSILQSERPDRELDTVNEKLNKLREDREMWTKEVESRARLQKLELEATFPQRMQQLEDKVNANTQAFSDTLPVIENRYRKLDKNVSDISKKLSYRLDKLEKQVKSNEKVIRRIEDRSHYYYYPRYPRSYLYYQRHYDRDSNN